jgi:hypothetical protein
MVVKQLVVSTRSWCTVSLGFQLWEQVLMGEQATSVAVVAAKHGRMYRKLPAHIMVKIGTVPGLVPRGVVISMVRLVALFHEHTHRSRREKKRRGDLKTVFENENPEFDPFENDW